MLPDNALSTTAVPTPFLAPRNRKREKLVDYELAGVAINDPTQGLRVKVWRAQYDGADVVLDAEGVSPTVVISVAGITEIAATFDQNMQPALAYLTAADDAFLYWFDATLPGFTTLALPAGTYSPRITLDDKRATQTANSDIILTYMRGGALYYRQQRDRFLIEYELATGLEGYELGQFGMNRRLRLQWQLVLRPPEEL